MGWLHGRRHTLFFAVLAGFALGICPAPREWPATAFIGVAFLYVACRGPEGAAPSVKRGLLAGFVCSFIINAWALYWVKELLEVFAGFPVFFSIPVASLLFAAQSLPMALALAGAAALASRGARLHLVLPPALVAASSLSPSLFPWRIGNSQTGWIEWIQLAEVGGQPLLDLFLAYAGTSLACAALATDLPLRRRALPLALGAFALLFPYAYGAVRVPQVEAARAAAPHLAVGVVQPNVSIMDKADRRRARLHLLQLQSLTARVERAGADLVVWPETAHPFAVRRTRRRDEDGPRILDRGVRGPLIVGTITIGGPNERYNSAVAVDRQGRYFAVADKVELLAFGEYVPLWDYLPPLQTRFRKGLTPGVAPRVIPIAGADVAVLNCYEDVLDHYAQRVARQQPDFFVNITNDAWFGDTSEPWLHDTVARLRAVETRRDLVRAVNTGVSSHTSATGAPLYRTDTFVEATFVADVAMLSGQTPWVRFGDWVTPMLAGALLGTALALGRRRRSPL